MSSNFGIDLLFETQRGNIRSENDVLIVIIHWILCKNNFRSVGIGDNKIFSDQDRPTELLPLGWNQNQTSYTLRYTLNKTVYILYGIVSDDALIINLLDGKSLKTVGLVFKTKDVVKSKIGMALDDYVNNAQSIIDKMSDEIVKPILTLPQDNSPPQSSSSRIDDPLLIRQILPPMYHDRNRDPLRDIRDPLRDIGRGDLDPFGRGGGSIFQPDFRSDFNPPNPIIPPGARFDPPNPFRRLDPDNDHLRPPPGYDDMFM